MDSPRLPNYQGTYNYKSLKRKAKNNTLLATNAAKTIALAYSKYNGNMTEKQVSIIRILLGISKTEWVEIIRQLELRIVSEKVQEKTINPFYVTPEAA